MKTQVTRTENKTIFKFGLATIFLLAFIVVNPVFAQQGRTIKGVITNSDGPLESASVVLKGTKIGTSTNAKGEFTFPQPLNTGDVLQISYLGFEPQNVTIKANTDVLRLELTEDLVEFVGALNSNKPYKSKRSKE
ncbi:MAG TPA: carboxypeptidase-like regulatory domain-containing protein [Aquaticitalea sp.]|nr:carboxypeptidase-like regulatory domain-containing protein [Aquaticitalea sp.]